VVFTAIAVQLVTAGLLILAPQPHEPFTYGDVAEAIRSRGPVTREGQTLLVRTEDSAPGGWELDTRSERRVHATFAQLLGVPAAEVVVEPQWPFAFIERTLRPRTVAAARSGAPEAKPYLRGADQRFEDLGVAARLPDGRWFVVWTPTQWFNPLTALLIWIAGNMLLLVPLAWLFTRRLVEPIRTFAETAERAGRGDRDANFAAAGPREIRKAALALSEMQRRIEAAVEGRTRLIAAVAHDLRTPLTRLRFRAEYAPPEHRERIVHDIERMDAMIGGVLAFARGEERLNRTRLDLAALVQSVADDFAETGSDVAVAEAAPVEVVGDALALRRLAANLLDNAVKYGGSARCIVRREGGHALLLVEDEGPGMPADALERMFTPFERGDSARDPSTGGVGLGLALARGIARAHGGDVWLSLRARGGLCAHARLPAAASGQAE
jgi:two-component system OmpR family sensor kinase